MAGFKQSKFKLVRNEQPEGKTHITRLGIDAGNSLPCHQRNVLYAIKTLWIHTGEFLDNALILQLEHNQLRTVYP